MPGSRGDALSGLVWEILLTAGRLTEFGNRLTAPFGLTAARWQVMGVIVHRAATIADIGRRLSQSRQGVQRLGDELARDGFARYSPNPKHARAKLLGPTPQGAAAYREVMKLQAEWMDALSAEMQIEDIAAARALLATLASGLEEGRRRDAAQGRERSSSG
ncbi:MarR family winged helix-turn-helix transcriptional regulator [Methylosinus sporium]|uniref:MarR family winged helix-turn-helix transcriptional regulator n=1 Tax=Methylosinus sporium TaxID=428 RepID=UPI00383A3FBB